MAFKLHKTPFCKLSLRIKTFFDASVGLHHILRWPVLLWLLLSLLFLILMVQFILPIQHKGQRRSLLLKAKQLHLEMSRKYQKHAVSTAILSHWSSFNCVLGLTTLAHSLTSDDGAHLWLANWADQIRKAGGLISGRSSKLELDLEATLLSLYDKEGKSIGL